MVDPGEMQNVILPLIDRLIAPVVQRLDQSERDRREDTQHLYQKIDSVLAVVGRVHATETDASELKSRMDAVEISQAEQSRELARTQGRNDVIVWILGLLGAPVVVALALAGIAKLFNIPVGI